ncbi:riboflavin synthase [Ruminococcus flavefaciens]|uniref:Riboflavin synthase n=1 Tax=Ruminococcus flavefaciens TaxID=1265 RepID=A0A1M7MNB1_RUMFL|nr:riboflavin synthase [Ruminococcus flavefaciens]SHM91968.1 riboflavin synthase alpha chain [Ruminococcus flavefaciens]
MFTGIIEEIGTVCSVKRSGSSSFIEIQAKKVLEDVHMGDSIAVNGVCLTVTHFGGGVFRADVMNETLSRSSLGSLTSGSPVNLERAMAAGGRFGGHIVSGHIDGTGTITDIKNDGIAVWYTVSAAPELLRYIVEKGSIAIDGISLTVAKVTDTSFSVSIIPHTASQTILGSRKVGDIVNLENDIIGKYVEKLMKPSEAAPQSSLSMEMLAKHGFI